MSIYYAHSMRTYGTRVERKQLRQLRKFTNEITNPNGLLSRFGWQAQARALIDMCDCLVFSEYQDWIGKGVEWEIQYAHNQGKIVYALREGVLFPIQPSDITVAGWDWAVRWAYVDVGTYSIAQSVAPLPWLRRLFGSRLSLV